MRRKGLHLGGLIWHSSVGRGIVGIMKSLKNALLGAMVIAFTAAFCSAETLGLRIETSPHAQPTMTVAGENTLSIASHDLDDARIKPGDKTDDFANVDQTPIPEPPVYMLLGIGLLLCAQRIRRRMAAK